MYVCLNFGVRDVREKIPKRNIRSYAFYLVMFLTICSYLNRMKDWYFGKK